MTGTDLARTVLGRLCRHPHQGRHAHAGVPAEPTGTFRQLVLYTEMGPVPYCGMDNRRAEAAADRLGRRHVDAGIASGYDFEETDPDSPGYCEQRWAVPQLVLSAALAEAEGRLCVADSQRKRLMERALND